MQVVKNQLNSPKLKWLTEKSLHDELIGIFQEIKILTGAIMHDPGEDVLLQIKVLKLFLLSSPQFINLTTNEIRHAFYLNSQGEYDEVHRHFNKPLNAEFMGDVLRGYVKYKYDFHKRFSAEIKELIEPTAATSVIIRLAEDDYRDIIQRHYNSFLTGSTEFIFPSTSIYQLLRQYGGIQIYSRQHWFKLIGYAIDDRIRRSRGTLFKKDAWEKDNILQLRKIYETYQLEGWIPPSEYRMVIYTLQKRLYFKFLKTMAYFGIKDIFKEITVTKL